MRLSRLIFSVIKINSPQFLHIIQICLVKYKKNSEFIEIIEYECYNKRKINYIKEETKTCYLRK